MRYPDDHKRMRAMKIVLTDELRSWLSAAAAASGRSIADEVRCRLAWTFAEHVVDSDLRHAGKRLWVEAQWMGME